MFLRSKKQNYENYDIIMKKYSKQMRRKRINTIKSTLLYIVLIFGVVGGYKALLSSESLNDEVNSKALVEISNLAEEYITRYFSLEESDIQYIRELTATNVGVMKSNDKFDKDIDTLHVSNVVVTSIYENEDYFEVTVQYVLDGMGRESDLIFESFEDEYYVSNALIIESTLTRDEFTDDVEIEDGVAIPDESMVVANSLLTSFFTSLNSDTQNNTSEALIFYDEKINVPIDTSFDVSTLRTHECVELQSKVTQCKMSISQVYAEKYYIDKVYIVELNLNSNKILKLRGE